MNRFNTTEYKALHTALSELEEKRAKLQSEDAHRDADSLEGEYLRGITSGFTVAIGTIKQKLRDVVGVKQYRT